MRKIFFLSIISFHFLILTHFPDIMSPNIAIAAVNLPWSTTYNCPEWTWNGANELNCDGINNDTGGTCDNGVGREQITASANYSGGAGGKGQRHWMGDGVNNVSGGLYLSFSSPQSEIWMRWYMRYEKGFQWAELVNQKIIYFDPVSVPRLVVGYEAEDRTRFYSYASNTGYYSPIGWTDVMGGNTSDGLWHLWEVHFKIDTNGSNGILELWIDQQKVINVNNANLAAAPISNVLIGSNGFTPGNGRCMYIDYDDIAISNTGPIGPIGGNTPPPSLGGDTSSSGGSGCGFVKDSLSRSRDNAIYNLYFLDSSFFVLFLFLLLLKLRRLSLWHKLAKSRVVIIESVVIITCLLLFPALSTGAILFQEDFEDTNFTSRSWYDSTSLKLSTTEHHSGNSSVEYHFLTGATTPEISGGAIRRLFTPSDSIYVSYYVKYSSNWTGSNKNYHPHEFFIMTNENNMWDGPAYSHLTAYVEQNEGVPLLAIQDGQNIDLTKLNQDLTNITENRAVAGCNGVPSQETTSTISCYPVSNMYWNGKDWRAGSVYFQDTQGPYYKNDWHHVEAYFKLNSIVNGKGAADGIIRYWYDGNLIIERTNIIIRTGQYPNMMFNQFLIAPWIGDGSPVDQTMWVDNLTVGTSRDGGTGGGNTPPPSLGGDTTSSGGSGCGFVKDNSSNIGSKSHGVRSESGNILSLALLILLLTFLKLKVMFQQAIGGYNKMNKLFSAIVFSLILFYNPAITNAAVNLPWSTTYNCPEWTQSVLDNLNCNGLGKYGDWTTADGSKEQITAAANNPCGAGGKGQRHWLGNRVTVDEANSGGTRLDFASPQPELWVRWYMRFQKDFQWDPNNHPSFKALFFDVGPSGVTTQFFGWEIVRFWIIAGDGTQIPGSTIGGWDTIMANGANDGNGHKKSDGQWHYYEIHMKMDTNGSNGIGEIWVDGVKRFSYSNLYYGTKGGWSWMAIGSNHNYSTNGGDMYIDYDDIAISATGPIGPIGGNTPPPSSGDGGDSSASGGSGCGYIKDANSKGQKAKSEGLSLIIMLIITLAGIAIARRTKDFLRDSFQNKRI